MNKITNYIKLMRPHHYIKNLLIFLPIIFSKNMLNMNYLNKSIIGFIAFCLISSTVYIFNDIMDVENDKKHEKKKLRPIASGKVSIKNASILAILLFFVGVVLNTYFMHGTIESLLLLLAYMILNICYSIKLKYIPILDIVILALGFFMRVLYGAVITNIEISNWLYLTIISFSFYMGLGKRRNELKKLGSSGRKVLESYTESFLNSNMYMCMALGIIFYSLWCININEILSSRLSIIWTVPFVLIICMKYNLAIEKETSLGDPVDVIMKDKILIALIAIYTFIIFGYIYLL